MNKSSCRLRAQVPCLLATTHWFFPTSLCGVLVFGSAFPPAPSPSCPPAACLTQNLSTHNLLTRNLSTHNLLTHTTYSHTTCQHTTYSHTTCPHTQLAHTELTLTQLPLTLLVPHNLLTHTTYSHTTYNLLLPHKHNLSTQLVHTQLTHTQLTHTQLTLTQLTLTHTQLTLTLLASHTTCPHTTRPRTTYPHTTYSHTTYSHTTYSHTTYSHTSCPHTQLTHTQLVHTTYSHTHNFSTHNKQLAHTQLTLTRQAWHLVTWTSTWRGRRGTWWHRRAFCVAGVALTALGWRWWRAWCLVRSGGRCRRGCLRGRRGTWRHRPPLGVAGVALGDIGVHFATSTSTWRHHRALCVAGVALAALTWRSWRASFSVDAVVAVAVCVAGVALGNIDLRFAWHAWHLATWTSTAGSGGALGSQWTPLSLLLFAWQAWQTVRVCNSVISFALRSGCVASPSRRMITSRHWSWNVDTWRLVCVNRAEAFVAPATLNRKVSHCQMNNGCPVAPLDALQVYAQLGLISVGEMEASFVRCLVAFIDVQLADDEALQQDNTSTSAMRVKRSVDCLLPTPAASGEPSRVQLRSAGPASAVAWMLRGHAGEAPFVVLAHTSDDGEWSVLWHVPVEAHRVEGGKNFMMRIYQSEVKTPQTLTYDQAWAPMKRLASVMEQTPEDTSLTLRCRVSRHAIDAPCENLSSLLPVLWCTRLDWRAVRKSLVAATRLAVQARQFWYALGAEEKKPLITKSHNIACGLLHMSASMEDVLERHVCWTCFDVSAEASIDIDCRAGNSCFASWPTSVAVHACCCCLTCLTCQVPLRSSVANLLHSPSACSRPSALMTVSAHWLATLHMLPRPATAIHLYSWCWHAGFGYIHISIHTLHYITLRYATLRYITLHYITIHTYITLHYIHTYIYTYIHAYIDT